MVQDLAQDHVGEGRVVQIEEGLDLPLHAAHQLTIGALVLGLHGLGGVHDGLIGLVVQGLLDVQLAVGANRINVSEQSYSIQGQMDTPILTGGHKHVMNDEEWDRFCAGLNTLGKIAVERGFKLCFHHHMGTVVQTSEETDRMMANTDPRYVFLCYDTGHFTFAGEDPLAMLKKYVDRVGHVHLKDMRLPVVEEARKNNWSFLQSVRNGAFTVPGDGDVDFDPVFKVLSDAGYQGWLLVEAEQDPAKANPLEYAMKGRKYIKEHTGL